MFRSKVDLCETSEGTPWKHPYERSESGRKFCERGNLALRSTTTSTTGIAVHMGRTKFSPQILIKFTMAFMKYTVDLSVGTGRSGGVFLRNNSSKGLNVRSLNFPEPSVWPLWEMGCYTRWDVRIDLTNSLNLKQLNLECNQLLKTHNFSWDVKKKSPLWKMFWSVLQPEFTMCGRLVGDRAKICIFSWATCWQMSVGRNSSVLSWRELDFLMLVLQPYFVLSVVHELIFNFCITLHPSMSIQ